jgi:hypothetical protein
MEKRRELERERELDLERLCGRDTWKAFNLVSSR